MLRHGREKKIISYRIKSLLPSKIYRLYQSIYKKLLYCYGIPFSNARYATALNRLNYIFYKGSIYNAKFSFPKMLTGLYPPETIPLPSGPAGSGTTRLPPLLRRRLVRPPLPACCRCPRPSPSRLSLLRGHLDVRATERGQSVACLWPFVHSMYALRNCHFVLTYWY